MPQFTMQQLAAAAAREVTMRKRVYRRWAQEGRLGWSEARAENGIAEMEEIEKILRELAAKEETQGSLL